MFGFFDPGVSCWLSTCLKWRLKGNVSSPLQNKLCIIDHRQLTKYGPGKARKPLMRISSCNAYNLWWDGKQGHPVFMILGLIFFPPHSLRLCSFENNICRNANLNAFFFHSLLRFLWLHKLYIGSSMPGAIFAEILLNYILLSTRLLGRYIKKRLFHFQVNVFKFGGGQKKENKLSFSKNWSHRWMHCPGSPRLMVVIGSRISPVKRRSSLWAQSGVWVI